MGIFSRDREDDVVPAAVVEAPHPALASLATFRDASLTEAAAAILVFGFSDAEPGHQLSWAELTLRAQELYGPVTGLKGSKLLMHFQDHDFEIATGEALGALARSLLIDISHSGSSSMSTNLAITRRGRRALDSGAPKRWIDVPADPV